VRALAGVAVEDMANPASSVMPSRETTMAPEVLFKLANLFAVAGWICLIAGIVTNRPWLRDRLAGLYWPLTIAVGYALAIMAAWSASEGGFASLTEVRQLFAAGCITSHSTCSWAPGLRPRRSAPTSRGWC
jgi:hypothetical protein